MQTPYGEQPELPQSALHDEQLQPTVKVWPLGQSAKFDELHAPPHAWSSQQVCDVSPNKAGAASRAAVRVIKPSRVRLDCNSVLFMVVCVLS
jgi:hypothetical protein